LADTARVFFVAFVLAAAVIPDSFSPTEALAYRLTAARRCKATKAPASTNRRTAYQRQVASKRSQLTRERAQLARQQHLLAQAEHHTSARSRLAAQRAKIAIRRLRQKLACLSGAVSGISPDQAAGGSADGASARQPDQESTANGSGVAELPAFPEPLRPPAGESTAPTGAQSAPIIESISPSSNTHVLSIAVSGNHFVNASGRVVTLHGVNVSSSEWQCLYGQAFESPSNEASIAAIVSWHINAVRIPLNEDCWLGINGAPTDIETYHEEIRDYVDRLHAHGIYAILDLHWSAPGTTLSHLGAKFNGYYEMADESHSPAFWESVASYFANDHAVLFDLFNEPFGISWRCWLNGCVAPRGFRTAGMQQLVNAVRSTGATQPIMVGGLEHAGEAGEAWLTNRPKDPANQLAASVHLYGLTSADRLERNMGIVSAQFPVVIGEIGEFNCADNDLEALLPWADAKGISYLAWAWYTGECGAYPALISNYSGTPTNYGIGYREHLMATFPATTPPE
jgi:endoglucanase